jgi:hypothetical protein
MCISCREVDWVKGPVNVSTGSCPGYVVYFDVVIIPLKDKIINVMGLK